MDDKYYAIIRWGKDTFRPGKITIEVTYGDHVWGGPSVEVIDYADSRKEAQKIARNARRST